MNGIGTRSSSGFSDDWTAPTPASRARIWQKFPETGIAAIKSVDCIVEGESRKHLLIVGQRMVQVHGERIQLADIAQSVRTGWSVAWSGESYASSGCCGSDGRGGVGRNEIVSVSKRVARGVWLRKKFEQATGHRIDAVLRLLWRYIS